MADQASPKRSSNTKALVVVGVLVLGTAIVFGSGRGAQEGRPVDLERAAAEAVQIEAAEMTRAFGANEVAAEQRFGDKPLLVSGSIAAIGLNDAGQPWLALDGAGVLAVLGEDQADGVARLAKGDRATVLCTERLKMDETQRLDGCVLR